MGIIILDHYFKDGTPVKTLNSFSTKVPSDISVVCETVHDIICYVRKYYGDLAEENLFEIKVIINELILNAIKHGNKLDCSKFVKIKAGITRDDYMFLLIEDEGKGHSCKCIPESKQSIIDINDVCNMKETGRGILIVKSLCDRLKFNEKGNKVVILKKLIKE